MFEFEDKIHFYEDKVNSALRDDIGDSLSTVFLDLLTNICNFDCIFCDAKQFYNVKDNSFSRERLDRMALELKELNVDSVLLVGEGGEPIIHPYFSGFSNQLLGMGFRMGIYTNGSILKKTIFDTLADFEFVRISLNAGTRKSHEIIHRYNKNITFENVLKFIYEVARVNKNSVGVSSVLIRENMDEMYETAWAAKDNGAGYVEFKPAYGKDYLIDKELYEKNIDGLIAQIERVKELEDQNFKVVLNNQLKGIYKSDFLDNVFGMTTTVPRRCLTSKLRMVVSPSGCYLCTPHRSKAKYQYGNPQRESLVSIWYGLKHKELTCLECNLKCAYHEQNEFLLRQKQAGTRFVSNPYINIAQKSFL